MANPTILITRPQGDENELSEMLHEQDFRVIHEPLTDVLLRHDMRHEVQKALLGEPDAVIVTSRHGIQALALLTELRDVFVLCVGEATAAAAQSLGFDHVSAARGNVDSLVDYIAEGYDEGSRFLYVSGEHIRADLSRLLPEMQVQRIVAYETVSAEQFSDTLTEQLRRSQIDAVTLMSQRTAAIFVMLLTKAGLRDTTKHIRAICLSPAVAEPLAAHNWRGVHIAESPTLASLVDCAAEAFKQPESHLGL